MEIAKAEVAALQDAVVQSVQENANQLTELHAALSVGIAADPIFA